MDASDDVFDPWGDVRETDILNEVEEINDDNDVYDPWASHLDNSHDPITKESEYTGDSPESMKILKSSSPAATPADSSNSIPSDNCISLLVLGDGRGNQYSFFASLPKRSSESILSDGRWLLRFDEEELKEVEVTAAVQSFYDVVPWNIDISEDSQKYFEGTRQPLEKFSSLPRFDSIIFCFTNNPPLPDPHSLRTIKSWLASIRKYYSDASTYACCWHANNPTIEEEFPDLRIIDLNNSDFSDPTLGFRFLREVVLDHRFSSSLSSSITQISTVIRQVHDRVRRDIDHVEPNTREHLYETTGSPPAARSYLNSIDSSDRLNELYELQVLYQGIADVDDALNNSSKTRSSGRLEALLLAEEVLESDLRKLRQVGSACWEFKAVEEALQSGSLFMLCRALRLESAVPIHMASSVLNLDKDGIQSDIAEAISEEIETSTSLRLEILKTWSSLKFFCELASENTSVEDYGLNLKNSFDFQELCQHLSALQKLSTKNRPQRTEFRLLERIISQHNEFIEAYQAARHEINPRGHPDTSSIVKRNPDYQSVKETLGRLYARSRGPRRLLERESKLKSMLPLGAVIDIHLGRPARECVRDMLAGDFLATGEQEFDIYSLNIEPRPPVIPTSSETTSSDADSNVKDKPRSAYRPSCKCGKDAERNVLFIGTTQSGKSSTIRSIMNFGGITDPKIRPAVGEGTRSETSIVKTYKVVLPLRRLEATSNSSENKAVRVFNDESLYELEFEDYERVDETPAFCASEMPELVDFTIDELEELIFKATSSDCPEDGGHIHLNLIDTPGLNDTENLHRSNLLNFEGTEPAGTLNTIDEEHKVKILRAMYEAKTIHAICFVMSVSDPYNEGSIRIMKYYLDMFRESGLHTVEFHIIHTKTTVETMFTTKCQARKRGVERMFNISASHHFLENLIDDCNYPQLTVDVHQHSIDRLLRMLLEAKEDRIYFAGYIKSADQLSNDSIIQSTLSNVLFQVETEIKEIENQLQSLTRLRREPEIHLRNAEAAVSDLNKKIKVHDNESHITLEYVHLSQSASPFNWYPKVQFALSTNIPIRTVWKTYTGTEGTWSGNSGGEGQTYFNVMYQANKAFENVDATVILYGWKKDRFAEEIKDWKRQLENRKSDVRRHQARLQEIEMQAEKLNLEKTSLETKQKIVEGDSNNFFLKRRSFPGNMKPQAGFLTTGDLYCAAEAYGLSSRLPLTSLQPDGEVLLKDAYEAVEHEKELVQKLKMIVGAGIDDTQGMATKISTLKTSLERRLTDTKAHLELLHKLTTTTPVESKIPERLHCSFVEALRVFHSDIQIQQARMISAYYSFDQLISTLNRALSEMKSQDAHLSNVLRTIKDLFPTSSAQMPDPAPISTWIALQTAMRRNRDIENHEKHPVIDLIYSMAKQKEMEKMQWDGEVVVQESDPSDPASWEQDLSSPSSYTTLGTRRLDPDKFWDSIIFCVFALGLGLIGLVTIVL